MNNGYKFGLGLAAVVASLVLVGCGGGGGSTAVGDTSITKQLKDAPIVGATYICSSTPDQNGTTDANGYFTCNIGDSVEFFAGNYPLGTLSEVTGTELPVSPYNLYKDPVSALDFAQLVQTIDDPNDGFITIPENYSALDNVTARPGDAGFDTNTELTDALRTALVDEKTAQANIYSDATAELLAGKTVYTTLPDDDMIFGVKLTFSDDLTKVTWKNLMSGQIGIESLTINDGTIVINIPNDPNKIISNVTLDANAATYYKATIDGTPCKLYLNETTFTSNTISLTDIDSPYYYTDLANTGEKGYKLTVNIAGALDPAENVTYYFASNKMGVSYYGNPLDYIAFRSNGTVYDKGYIDYYTSGSIDLYSQNGTFATYLISDGGPGNPEILRANGATGTWEVFEAQTFSLTILQ